MTKVRARWLLLFFTLVTLLPQCTGIDDLVGDFILANGSNPSDWFNSGWTLVDQSNYDEAAKSREIAIQPDPKLSSLSWYYQGLNNLLKREYNKSIFYYERAIEIYPKYEGLCSL
jgi:tetratricopeptide (TPR) repeat protein